MATPSIGLSGTASITEGSSGTKYATYTVTLTKATTSDVVVQYATASGSATSDSDFGTMKGTLTIKAGSTTGTINVPIYGDSTYEGNETFSVRLNSATNANLTRRRLVTTTITNDDSASKASNKAAGSGAGDAASQTLSVVSNTGLSAMACNTHSAMMAPLFDSAFQALSQTPASQASGASGLSCGESSQALDTTKSLAPTTGLVWGISS